MERRNTIATLLQDWGLVSIVNKDVARDCAFPRGRLRLSRIKRSLSGICNKYNIGNS